MKHKGLLILIIIVVIALLVYGLIPTVLNTWNDNNLCVNFLEKICELITSKPVKWILIFCICYALC